MWSDPLEQGIFGVYLHIVSPPPELQYLHVLLYCAKLGVSHSADNQAFRTEWVSDRLCGMKAPDLMWAMQTDNTGSAANIGDSMGIQGMRCFDHLFNLTPRHLLFPVERVVDGQRRHVMHDLAVPEVFDLCQKVRAEVKKFKYSEEESRALARQVNLRPHMKTHM